MEKTFKSTGTFTAINDATKWLQENGFSVGRMCSPDPIGFKKGDWNIMKWRNLSNDDRGMLDGRITSSDFREGDVIVTFNEGVTI